MLLGPGRVIQNTLGQRGEEYNQDVNIITSHSELGAADGGVTTETSQPSNIENIPVTKYQSVSSFQFLNLTEEMHFEVETPIRKGER